MSLTLFPFFALSGSEVTQSYCPLDWSFEERQMQCREVYGFTCNCPRCQYECTVEEASEHSDDDDMGQGGGGEVMGSVEEVSKFKEWEGV